MLTTLMKKMGLNGSVGPEQVMAAERDYLGPAYSAHFDSQYPDYLAGDFQQFVQQQYPEYVKSQYSFLDPEAYPEKDRPWYGLALSGGGIRSASFAIGVIQALNNKGFLGDKPPLFDRVAYQSSVSGGGYTGAALNWHQKLHDLFPFGDIGSYAGSNYSEKPGDLVLSHIRQHGKYLTPRQLGLPSLLGTILLSLLHSVVAYTLFFTSLLYLLTLLISSDWVSQLLNLSLFNDTSVKALLHDFSLPLTQLRADGYIDEDKLNFSSFFISLALLMGTLYLLLVFFYGFSSYTRHWFSRAYCYRVWVQRLLGRLLVWTAVALFFAGLPLAFFAIFGASLEKGDNGLMGSLTSALVAIASAIFNFRKKAENNEASRSLFNKVLTWASVLLFTFSIFLLSYALAESYHDAHRQGYLWPLLMLLVALAVLLLVNVNQVSPHKMYRDRLMETFMNSPGVPPQAPLCQRSSEANRTSLRDLALSPYWSPYHLINCNVILNNAANPKYRGRFGDSFTMSALYCGSQATQYVDTEHFVGGNMTLATAMSISGAAENPHAGVSGRGATLNPMVAFLMSFLGLRLGYWAYSPASPIRRLGRVFRPNYLLPGLYGLLNFGHAEDSTFVELSDGGHFDNTGLYELVRRRLPVIILSDGGADPNATFDDFGNAVERIRVDFGVSVRFCHPGYELAGMLPGSQAAVSLGAPQVYDAKYQLAERGFAIADLVYPDARGQKGFVGRLVYIKATLTRNLPGDLYAYRASYPSYPNQPTLDQFFDERQFEAYRELGYQLTKQLLVDDKALALLP